MVCEGSNLVKRTLKVSNEPHDSKFSEKLKYCAMFVCLSAPLFLETTAQIGLKFHRGLRNHKGTEKKGDDVLIRT